MAKWRENKGAERQVKGHRSRLNVQQALLITGLQSDLRKNLVMGTKIDKDTWGCSIVIHFLNNIHLTYDNGGYQIVIVLPAQDWVYSIDYTAPSGRSVWLSK